MAAKTAFLFRLVSSGAGCGMSTACRRGSHWSGMPNRNIQTASKHYPDAQQKDKLNTARGDVPIWFLNSNELKDTLAGQFDRTDAAGGR